MGSGGWERSGRERRSEKIEESGTKRAETGEQRDSRRRREVVEGSRQRGTNPFGHRTALTGSGEERGEKREERRKKREETPKEAARGPQMRPPEVLKGEREADRRLESLHFKG